MEPIPGASAVAAAISASGVFIAGLHLSWVSHQLGQRPQTVVRSLQIARPNASSGLLRGPASKLKGRSRNYGILVNRPIIVGRELTKIHEEFVGLLRPNFWSDSSRLRAEFTILDSARDPALEPVVGASLER